VDEEKVRIRRRERDGCRTETFFGRCCEHGSAVVRQETVREFFTFIDWFPINDADNDGC
jgi:hypothetical protein